MYITHPAPKKVPFHSDFGRTCLPTQVPSDTPSPPAPPPRVRTVNSPEICLKHAWFWLTRVLKHYKRVKKLLNVQGINLFPCVYGSRMISVMLYSSIFAFYLSYYLYLYSIKSK